MSPAGLIILLVVTAAVAVVLWVRMPRLVDAGKGRLVLLLALLVMPLLLLQLGVSRSLTGSQQKDFCVSCHEMQVYDTSLHIDDPEYVPATHFQNRYVPQDTACYSCHTDYTLYGDVSAKVDGLKHVWVHYFGTVPPAGEIALYQPYPNANCLQCHEGARRFERRPAHNKDGVTLAQLYANEKSCVSNGCHDKIHDIAGLGRHDLWGDVTFPVPEGLDGGGGAADDPFADDPFADEPADDRPASEIDDLDALFDDPPPKAVDDDAPASEIDDLDALFDDPSPEPADDDAPQADPAAPSEDEGAPPPAPAGDADAEAGEGLNGEGQRGGTP